MRRAIVGATIALAAAVSAVLAPSASAATIAPTQQLVEPIGPPCNPTITQYVLAAVAGTVVPGQKIQYIQIAYNPTTGLPYLQPCVVTAV